MPSGWEVCAIEHNTAGPPPRFCACCLSCSSARKYCSDASRNERNFPFSRRRAAQRVFFQQVQQETLGQILRVVRRFTLPSQVGIQWKPVGAAQVSAGVNLFWNGSMPLARSAASLALRCSINEFVSSMDMRWRMKHEPRRETKKLIV